MEHQSRDRRRTDNVPILPWDGICRRKTKRKCRKPPLWITLLGLCDMCRKASTCPNFERRTINGVKGTCVDCVYLKTEKRRLWVLRISLIVTFLCFLGTTYAKFHI